MKYKSRRRKKSFLEKLLYALDGVCRKIASFFKKVLPARKEGEPIYKSRRLWAAVILVIVIAAAVVIPIMCSQAQPVSEEEQLPVVKLIPRAPVDLKLGSTGKQVYELKERLMELNYLESDEIAEETETDSGEEIEEEPSGDAESLAETETAETTETTETTEETAAENTEETADEAIIETEEEPEEEVSDEVKNKAEFDENVEQAVKRFQILCGDEPTGTVDTELWDWIFSDVVPEFEYAVGMEGDDIKEYQSRLYNLNYLSSEPNGVFDEETETAVKLFQQKNELEETGRINNEMRELLYSENVKANYMSIGQKSDEVAEMQARLISLGYLSGEPDGIYGEQTYAAVKLFQKKNDLVVDGYLGSQTVEVLISDDAEVNSFGIGDEGEEVTRLQERLVELNYINKSTGYFGSDTDLAVRNFQELNDLVADGDVGPLTMAKLYSDNPVKAKKTVKVGQSSKVNKFIEAAESKLGHKYVGGGKGPNVFDCSGLVYWCLKQAGVSQSYVTSVTWRKTGSYKTINDIDDVKKGDIICFSPHHVGIAISSSMMIDASSSNGKVVKRSFQTSYWRKHFVCARRVF